MEQRPANGSAAPQRISKESRLLHTPAPAAFLPRTDHDSVAPLGSRELAPGGHGNQPKRVMSFLAEMLKAEEKRAAEEKRKKPEDRGKKTGTAEE